MQDKLIVIVPAYNEADSISQTITSLLAKRDPIKQLGLDLKVYVVNDGSRDETARLASEAGADRIISHRVNQGLGAAVRSGLSAARTDNASIVVKFDADLQHSPDDIAKVIDPIVKDEADVVYGHRFNQIKYKMPFVRRMGNIVFTRLMRWLTGWQLKDSQPGIFAVNRAYLQVFRLPGNYNYTQQILLDAYHKGMRFEHVSVSFEKRNTGKSFISLKYPFKVLPQLVSVIVGVRPMKIFAPIGLAFLGVAMLVFFYQVAQYFLGITPKPVVSVNLVLGSVFFGLQTLFFGLLAQLIIEQK